MEYPWEYSITPHNERARRQVNKSGSSQKKRAAIHHRASLWRLGMTTTKKRTIIGTEAPSSAASLFRIRRNPKGESNVSQRSPSTPNPFKFKYPKWLLQNPALINNLPVTHIIIIVKRQIDYRSPKPSVSKTTTRQMTITPTSIHLHDLLKRSSSPRESV